MILVRLMEIALRRSNEVGVEQQSSLRALSVWLGRA